MTRRVWLAAALTPVYGAALRSVHWASPQALIGAARPMAVAETLDALLNGAQQLPDKLRENAENLLVSRRALDGLWKETERRWPKTEKGEGPYWVGLVDGGKVRAAAWTSAAVEAWVTALLNGLPKEAVELRRALAALPEKR